MLDLLRGLGRFGEGLRVNGHAAEQTAGEHEGDGAELHLETFNWPMGVRLSPGEAGSWFKYARYPPRKRIGAASGAALEQPEVKI